MITSKMRCGFVAAVVVTLCSCTAEKQPAATSAPGAEYYGTLEPFASEAVYFVVTDRFVDGDPANNHEDQGGEELGTFDREIQIEGLPPGNIGYLGGDFRGVLDNAAYIADMGFTALWMTPIVDNPDEAFSGGTPPGFGGSNDNGKTGYHGYWGVNFFEVDEHLESPGLTYSDLTQSLQREHGIKTILDIVANHGSPSFSMPLDQPRYGELYDAEGRLVADHGNLHPSQLDDANPLHAFYRREPDLAELSDMDYDNPDVLEYFVAAHSKWIDQGAAAVRIDTIKHMPHAFWKAFADRIREQRPGFFMFAEAWSHDAELLAAYTYPENGGISVLDFPGQGAMSKVFGKGGGSYAELLDYLHLDSGIYENPYDLMTFYDNHDMQRIDADQAGFIDANNWLFTSRGIPVVYYGSEMGFRAGTDQHSGNRDYFGQENIEQAGSHPIRAALASIADIRKGSVALQRGLQANLELSDDTAAFYRVYQKDRVNQTALVLLNKGDSPVHIQVSKWLSRGTWRDAASGVEYKVQAAAELDINVPAHGVRVLLFDNAVNDVALAAELVRLHQVKNRVQGPS
ncbi:MAG: alpha-amylase family glycosyl hydrolase [Gammaproteobacteria bacterium]|nr:alpha-amylase family glycosyl hydrolase [Gammaproteobacteria bacterium]MDH3750557.1 alpha-amylase family glycosyl hydrolase [Gammaproteobacteria bacterium]MDH3805784.1 alpha-amylase family glycosyl hydrolase [Gammaproteobacteria bacterium]